MKKYLLTLFFALLSVASWAYDVEIDGIYYNLISKMKVAEVTKGDNYYSGSVVIPEQITVEGVTYSVTIIGEGAFSGCHDMTSLIIPNSVTSIGYSAFFYCLGLTSLIIPNSVTSIGKNAFENSNHLISVTIGNSVKSIGSDAFISCSSLTSIEIPNSVTSIGSYAFCFCSGLTSVTIGNSLSVIENGVFYKCRSLKSIEIPNSVTSIGFASFAGCSGLKNVILGSGVQEVGNEAFSECENLERVTCLMESIPSTYSMVFENSYIDYAKLLVPYSRVDAYKSANVWKNFGTIESIKVNTNPSHFATYSAGFDWKVATAGVKAYKASVIGTTITLTELEGYIPAGEGVILSGDAASIENDVKGAASCADMSGNDLKGTTLSSGLLAEKPADKFVFALGAGNEFLHYTGSAFVHNRAYFEFDTDPTAAGAKMTLVFEDSESTGISTIDNGEVKVDNYKYIQNGQVVIVKNGQKFNVNGQVIK